MKTKITELFRIKYPILLSGMSFISIPKLVAAVSAAGGLGILATAPLNAEKTRTAIRDIRKITDKPFGANIPLLFPGAAEKAKVLLDEKVPVINFALGKGDWIVKAAHGYGGTVVATVVNLHHAKRAQDYGCDAVIATGHEAAAHGVDVTTLVLVPRLVDALKIPVVAAGGFADGRGLAAALTLGADGIAMGSRFMTTKESPCHGNSKRLAIEKEVTDTLYSDRFDGMPSRMIDSPGSRKALKRGLSLAAAFFSSGEIARELNVPFLKLFSQVLGTGLKSAMLMAHLAVGFKGYRLAIENGDNDEGILPIGQVTGLIHDIPTVAALIERIVEEARVVCDKSSGMLSK